MLLEKGPDIEYPYIYTEEHVWLLEAELAELPWVKHISVSVQEIVLRCRRLRIDYQAAHLGVATQAKYQIHAALYDRFNSKDTAWLLHTYSHDTWHQPRFDAFPKYKVVDLHSEVLEAEVREAALAPTDKCLRVSSPTTRESTLTMLEKRMRKKTQSVYGTYRL